MRTLLLARYGEPQPDSSSPQSLRRRSSWQLRKSWAPRNGLVVAFCWGLLAAKTASADLERPRISVPDARRSTDTSQGAAEKKVGLLADCYLGSTSALPHQRFQKPDRHRYALSAIATEGMLGAVNEMQGERSSAGQPIATPSTETPSTIAAARPLSHDPDQRRSRFGVLGEYVNAEVWRFAVVAKALYCQRFESVRQWYANFDHPKSQVSNPNPHRANLAGFIVRQQLCSERWTSWGCWLQTAREVSTAMADFGPHVLR